MIDLGVMEQMTLFRVYTDADLQSIVEPAGRMFVLFYSEWCPFSRMFLPIFETFSKGREDSCLEVVLDDDMVLWDIYDIKIVPTVLLFSQGSVTARLDGVSHEGLTERQLLDFASRQSSS